MRSLLIVASLASLASGVLIEAAGAAATTDMTSGELKAYCEKKVAFTRRPQKRLLVRSGSARPQWLLAAAKVERALSITRWCFHRTRPSMDLSATRHPIQR
jgi:hypothetical protein